MKVLLIGLTLLVPCVALAAGGGDAEKGSTALWEWVNLILLVSVLVFLARKPVLAYLGDRRSDIKNNIEGAEQLLTDAQNRLQEWQAKIDGMDAEVADIRRVAQAAAEKEREQIVADAHVVADRIQRTAVSAVERETRRARVALREEASELAVELAAGLLKNGVTDEDRDRLVNEFVERLDGESAGGSA